VIKIFYTTWAYESGIAYGRYTERRASPGVGYSDYGHDWLHDVADLQRFLPGQIIPASKAAHGAEAVLDLGDHPVTFLASI
jgi:hypothetical protein